MCTVISFPGSSCSLGMKLDLSYAHYILLPHPHILTHPHMHPTPPTLVHPVELVSTLREARSSGNDTKATRVLAGALKQLRLSRLKPDSTLNAALTSLAKEDSKLFNNPTAIEVQWKLISKKFFFRFFFFFFFFLNIFMQEQGHSQNSNSMLVIQDWPENKRKVLSWDQSELY